ncbi:Glycosyl transferases group 1 [Epsilonproteobacteria bacterium SCGC AD-308-E02]|nr:Glycosyl transferases group 1 [Epsilonproteobacteria bacterium SCGC AD-308-E02]
MPHRKLVVIGDGEDFENIKAIAKNNTTLLGYQEKKILIDYMQRAKAFVYAAVEDFGIIPIEALACGTPVIALNNGATAETIAHKINGIHFKNQNAEDIIYTINEFESLKFNLKEISEKAQTYSIHRFKKEIEDFVVSKIT